MARFTPDSSRRIAKQTRRAEKTPQTRVEAPPPPRISASAKYAIVTTAITSANRAARTLGKGAGTLQLVTYQDDDGAPYEDAEIPVPLYSGHVGPPIGVGRLVIVDFVDGRFNVIVDFC